MNGKGSKPRPLSIKRDDYDARWEAAFGKKKPNDRPRAQRPKR